MPYFFETYKIHLPEDKKYKLSNEDKRLIKKLYLEGNSIRSIARRNICSRRMIQFILFPDRYKRSLFIRIENGKKNNNYYEKDRHKRYMNKYRQEKNKKLKGGEPNENI